MIIENFGINKSQKNLIKIKNKLITITIINFVKNIVLSKKLL